MEARHGPEAPSLAASAKFLIEESIRASSAAPEGGSEVRFSSEESSLRRLRRRSGSLRKRLNQRVTGQPVALVASSR